MPQRRFSSIHVVGTNGKSSVATMTAALLEAAGTASGAYLSPHAERWSERVRLRDAEIPPQEFAAAVERVAQSVPAVDRSLEAGDAVTQFEAVTAAAFVALAAAGVEVGVIEAGLGGRLDATNVIPSRATALTSVGLEHTEWLGDTEEEIAGEKLAVLRDHSALVVGSVSEEVRALAERVARERHATLIDASTPAGPPALAPYLRRDLAVAIAAAEVVAGPLDPAVVERVASGLRLPGRMEHVASDPPRILDAAHNPDGARALAEGLDDAGGGRPLVACVAILSDKDAAGVIAALAPRLAALVATEIPPAELQGRGRPGARTLAAAELGALARAAGIERVEEAAAPAAAVRRADELARELGGVALVTGSHYLLAHGS